MRIVTAVPGAGGSPITGSINRACQPHSTSCPRPTAAPPATLFPLCLFSRFRPFLTVSRQPRFDSGMFAITSPPLPLGELGGAAAFREQPLAAALGPFGSSSIGPTAGSLAARCRRRSCPARLRRACCGLRVPRRALPAAPLGAPSACRSAAPGSRRASSEASRSGRLRGTAARSLPRLAGAMLRPSRPCRARGTVLPRALRRRLFPPGAVRSRCRRFPQVGPRRVAPPVPTVAAACRSPRSATPGFSRRSGGLRPLPATGCAAATSVPCTCPCRRPRRRCIRCTAKRTAALSSGFFSPRPLWTVAMLDR